MDEDSRLVLVYPFHSALKQDEDHIFDYLLLRLFKQWIIVLHKEMVEVYAPFRLLLRLIIEARIKVLCDSVIRSYLERSYPFKLL